MERHEEMTRHDLADPRDYADGTATGSDLNMITIGDSESRGVLAAHLDERVGSGLLERLAARRLRPRAPMVDDTPFGQPERVAFIRLLGRRDVVCRLDEGLSLRIVRPVEVRGISAPVARS